jgi:UDP-N-acetylmuramyl pentapeptide phosphotransferase/UDP-N-acetylglucosamine-1-phosphate transferase
MIFLKYSLALIFLVVAAIVYIKLANKFNIIDEPNHRSSHNKPVIRGGGILFFLAISIFFVLSNFEYPYFFTAICCVSLISFLDDLYALSSAIRLPFHFVTIALILFELDLLSLPWYFVGLILVAGVAFINMYNFMDGINGITAVYSLVTLLLLLYFSLTAVSLDTDLLLFCLLALVVFTYFNLWHRVRFFAGDIGSMSMASLLFFSAVYCMTALNAPVVLLMVAVYLADSGLTILQRLLNRENITEAHRRHVYQGLVDTYGWSHLKVAIAYGLLQFLINIVIILTYKLPLFRQYVILVCIGIILLFLYYFILRNLKIASSKN